MFCMTFPVPVLLMYPSDTPAAARSKSKNVWLTALTYLWQIICLDPLKNALRGHVVDDNELKGVV